MVVVVLLLVVLVLAEGPAGGRPSSAAAASEDDGGAASGGGAILSRPLLCVWEWFRSLCESQQQVQQGPCRPPRAEDYNADETGQTHRFKHPIDQPLMVTTPQTPSLIDRSLTRAPRPPPFQLAEGGVGTRTSNGPPAHFTSPERETRQTGPKVWPCGAVDNGGMDRSINQLHHCTVSCRPHREAAWASSKAAGEFERLRLRRGPNGRPSAACVSSLALEKPTRKKIARPDDDDFLLGPPLSRSSRPVTARAHAFIGPRPIDRVGRCCAHPTCPTRLLRPRVWSWCRPVEMGDRAEAGGSWRGGEIALPSGGFIQPRLVVVGLTPTPFDPNTHTQPNTGRRGPWCGGGLLPVVFGLTRGDRPVPAWERRTGGRCVRARVGEERRRRFVDRPLLRPSPGQQLAS